MEHIAINVGGLNDDKKVQLSAKFISALSARKVRCVNKYQYYLHKNSRGGGPNNWRKSSDAVIASLMPDKTYLRTWLHTRGERLLQRNTQCSVGLSVLKKTNKLALEIFSIQTVYALGTADLYLVGFYGRDRNGIAQRVCVTLNDFFLPTSLPPPSSHPTRDEKRGHL